MGDKFSSNPVPGSIRLRIMAGKEQSASVLYEVSTDDNAGNTKVLGQTRLPARMMQDLIQDLRKIINGR